MAAETKLMLNWVGMARERLGEIEIERETKRSERAGHQADAKRLTTELTALDDEERRIKAALGIKTVRTAKPAPAASEATPGGDGTDDNGA